MKEIKLNKHFLIEIESNKFLFMPNKKEDLDHMRVIYDTNNSEKIFAIDPPDGPFIAVGAEVKGILGKISNIYFENSLIYIKFSDGK